MQDFNVQTQELSNTTVTEDAISIYFSLSDCPKVLNTPLSIDSETGEVKRAKQDESVFDEYAG